LLKATFQVARANRFRTPATARGKSRLLLSLLSQLELLIQDIQRYDQDIENLVKSHPDSVIFLELKGAGTNLAARIW
jgi:transposase